MFHEILNFHLKSIFIIYFERTFCKENMIVDKFIHFYIPSKCGSLKDIFMDDHLPL